MKDEEVIKSVKEQIAKIVNIFACIDIQVANNK